MELSTVKYTVDESVAIVSLNRPKAMNALNKQIFVDLTTAFEAARDDEAIRVVILAGEGRAFCAGGDIPEMKSLDTEEAVFDFYNAAGIFMTLMINFPKPVITAGHGAIAGAGTSLLMAGDIALISDDVMFIVAFSRVGLIPDSAGHWLLTRAVGPNIAKELTMTQRTVKADELKTLGIANYVYPADQLMAEALKLAKKIAKGPVNCYAMSKTLINKAYESALAPALEEETKYQVAARLHPNGNEGLSAFLEKRSAQFK